MTYFETSSVEDTNVEMAYVTLTATIIQRYKNKCIDTQSTDVDCSESLSYLKI